MAYNSSRGYHLQIYTKKGQTINDLSKEFVKISKTNNSMSFTTEKLVNLNDRLNELMQDIYMMSNRFVCFT